MQSCMTFLVLRTYFEDPWNPNNTGPHRLSWYANTHSQNIFSYVPLTESHTVSDRISIFGWTIPLILCQCRHANRNAVNDWRREIKEEGTKWRGWCGCRQWRRKTKDRRNMQKKRGETRDREKRKRGRAGDKREREEREEEDPMRELWSTVIASSCSTAHIW